jgi:hypothetical protein
LNVRLSDHGLKIWTIQHLAWYAEFLLKMDLKILLRKTGGRLIFKIALISLHIDPDAQFQPFLMVF